MDPVTLVLIPGFLGGLAIAGLITRLHRTGPSPHLEAPTRLSISTDVINIAHIRAAGLGGLGLFAMALVVALFVPRIRMEVGVGAVCGIVLGVVMILRRRRSGPLPSSGGTAGANVILSIDQPVDAGNGDSDKSPNRLRTSYRAV